MRGGWRSMGREARLAFGVTKRHLFCFSHVDVELRNESKYTLSVGYLVYRRHSVIRAVWLVLLRGLCGSLARADGIRSSWRRRYLIVNRITLLHPQTSRPA